MKQMPVQPLAAVPRQDSRQMRRKRAQKRFIEATHALITQHGIQQLSIRKIAKATGYGSATIYSYFSDLEELVVLASLKSRQEYLVELSRVVREEMSALEQYRKVYEVFNAYSFSEPILFMNLYFGGHADRIEELFDAYYALYPDEELPLPPFLYEALQKRNLFACDRVFVHRLAKEGFLLPEHVDFIADTIVRLQQTFIYDLILRPSLDKEAHSRSFLQLFDHIISLSDPTGRPKPSELAIVPF